MHTDRSAVQICKFIYNTVRTLFTHIIHGKRSSIAPPKRLPTPIILQQQHAQPVILSVFPLFPIQTCCIGNTLWEHNCLQQFLSSKQDYILWVCSYTQGYAFKLHISSYVMIIVVKQETANFHRYVEYDVVLLLYIVHIICVCRYLLAVENVRKVHFVNS